jgi:hypothetical protein
MLWHCGPEDDEHVTKTVIWDNTDRCVNCMTDALSYSAEVKNSGAIPPLLPYAFMA